MIIDLSALLRGEVHSVSIDTEIRPDSVPEGIELLPGARLCGTVTDNAGYIRLTTSAKVPFRGQCARCLDKVEDVLEFPFERTLVPAGTVSDAELEENAENYLIIENGKIAPDSAISEQVYLEFPMLLLCSPDCGGLCPDCGRKLLPGETCGCKPKEPDPRWSKLKDIRWDDEN